MKKRLLPLAIISFLLVACGEEEDNTKNESKQTDDKESIEVEKGLLNVEITLPATLFEGTEEEDILNNAKEEGIKNVTVNEDGSVTYKMSKKEHNKLIKEIEEELDANIEEIKNSEEYPSIVEISPSKDYTNYNVTVNREKYENSFDGFAILTLALSSLYYEAYNGVKESDLKVTVNLIDGKTKEVFDTSVYPDDLEDAAEETE